MMEGPYKDGYKYREVYGNHVIYHNGLVLSDYKRQRLNEVISRCWDSLPDETKIRINEELERERKERGEV